MGSEGVLWGCHRSKGLAYSQSSKEGSGRGHKVWVGCMGKDIRTLGQIQSRGSTAVWMGSHWTALSTGPTQRVLKVLGHLKGQKKVD